MLRAVSGDADAVDSSVVGMREAIQAAYESVRLARRYLDVLDPIPEIATRLQFAEAELVRASVALTTVELAGGTAVDPVSFALLEETRHGS
jgi:hypothetical protein